MTTNVGEDVWERGSRIPWSGCSMVHDTIVCSKVGP